MPKKLSTFRLPAHRDDLLGAVAAVIVAAELWIGLVRSAALYTIP